MDRKERKSHAGRKPTCRILMFKMLVLQRLHGLCDERLQYQVTDRWSFMRFWVLSLRVRCLMRAPHCRLRLVWLGFQSRC